MRRLTLSIPARKVTPAQWRFLILLVVSVWINYIDRANLSVAAPQLRSELSLSPSDLGILLSAFFWTYALMQPAAGRLVDRFNVSWVFAIGYFLWSGVTAATGLVSALLSERSWVISAIGSEIIAPFARLAAAPRGSASIVAATDRPGSDSMGAHQPAATAVLRIIGLSRGLVEEAGAATGVNYRGLNSRREWNWLPDTDEVA